ncbi:MAG: hypothetical protein KJ626_05285 [Verrucomicrobia bacterium]|nr:hypothetical protein [Verrucomicrobiota bacterium]
MKLRKIIVPVCLVLLLPGVCRARVSVEGNQIQFTLRAPGAAKVHVAGSWDGWINPVDHGDAAAAQNSLALGDDGLWRLNMVIRDPGEYQYRFIIDGQWKQDPENPDWTDNAIGNVNSVFSIGEGRRVTSPPGLPAGDGQIAMKVIDRRTGKPAGRAILKFTEPAPRLMTTAVDGSLILEYVARGTYTFAVARTGYEVKTAQVRTSLVDQPVEPIVIALESTQGDELTFYYNSYSPRARVSPQDIASVDVNGEFSRWQGGLHLADDDRDGVWSGTFHISPQVNESEYGFLVHLNGGSSVYTPDPDGDDVTETVNAECTFRRCWFDRPLIVIDSPKDGRTSSTQPEELLFRFIPAGTFADEIETPVRPSALRLIVNGEVYDIDGKELIAKGNGFAIRLPSLPMGEVSLSVAVKEGDALAQAAVTVWDGPVVRDIESRYAQDNPSSVAGPPSWLADAIIYQVLVRAYKDSDGDGIGDFAGMIEKLDHIKDMGVNALLLMPVWDGPSGHGYTPESLFRVEKDYGTDDDFRRLVDACHEHGIRVILDYNDTTTFTGHPLFGPAVVFAGQPFRDWIYWIGPNRYSAYSLTDDLINGAWPQFNYVNPQVRRYFIEILLHWMREFGVDGFRMDSVERIKPFPSHDWWRILRRELKSVDSDALLLGELFSADNRYFDREFDIGYDAAFNHALMQTATGKGSAVDFAATLRDRCADDPTGTRLLRFLSNHDIDRWMTSAGGDLASAKLGLAALLTLPGVPSLYYGCEFGMTGGGIWGPNENRGYMEWKEKYPLHEMIAKLGRLRSAEPALRNSGTCEILSAGDETELVVIQRRSRAVPRTDDFVLAFNFGHGDARCDLPEGEWKLVDGVVGEDGLIPAKGFAIWRSSSGFRNPDSGTRMSPSSLGR